MAVDGTGTTGCHGFLQRSEITWREAPVLTPDERAEAGLVLPAEGRGAEGVLYFTPMTKAAAKWLGVQVGETFQSRPRYAAYRPL